MKIKNVLLIVISIIITACSATQEISETDKSGEPDIYVFDDVDKIDSVSTQQDSSTTNNVFPIPPEEKLPPLPTNDKEQKITAKYIVQVGAFSSKERAQRFVNENKNKIEQDMTISFNNHTNLFVVQLPSLNTREEAEQLRNSIWNIPVFKDAFIITLEE